MLSWSCSGCELSIDGKFIEACPLRQFGEDSRYALGFDSDCRGAESARIECGKAHFNVLKVGESPAR